MLGIVSFSIPAAMDCDSEVLLVLLAPLSYLMDELVDAFRLDRIHGTDVVFGVRVLRFDLKDYVFHVSPFAARACHARIALPHLVQFSLVVIPLWQGFLRERLKSFAQPFDLCF